MDEKAVRVLLEAENAAYPCAEAQDLVKVLYQAIHGPGHFVGPENGEERAKVRIACEAASAPAGENYAQLIGSRYARVYLARGGSLTDGMLAHMFVRSAVGETEEGKKELLRAVGTARGLVSRGVLRPAGGDALEYFDAYIARGLPSVHHSDGYRAAYRPSYRVCRAEYARALPLIVQIERKLSQKGSCLVAIDGGSATGKTTLAETLRTLYGAAVFHMDDFFLRPEQRTEERFAEPGGNVDRERFMEEVLTPICRGKEVTFRPFDCSRMALGTPVTVPRAAVTVVEGAYSCHPYFGDKWDVTCFTETDRSERERRILLRNGEEKLKIFLARWIPLEDRYFAAYGIREKADIRLRL